MTQGQGRTLVLFRHAKSAWPDVADHDRPLAPRGRRDAPVMGAWLRDAGLLPDRVLCSTARRARETWQLAQTGLGTEPPVSFERGVYDSAADGLLTLVRQASAAVTTLLVIGHNPTNEDLAFMLAAPTPGDGAGSAPDDAAASAMERMRAKFPTAAIAVLGFAGTWRGLGQGKARLTAFVTPRDPASQRPAIP